MALDLDPQQLERAILELASGEPDYVMVDRRVLRLIMGPLADLLVQIPVQMPPLLSGGHDPDEEGYVWDSDPLC